MDYMYLEKLDNDIDWVLDNVDLDTIRKDHTIPMQDGERTNYKLRDQPFYHRGTKGKMRGW